MSYSLGYTQSIALLISIGGQTCIKGVQWVSASFLSKEMTIPRPTVVNLLGKLIAAGLIISKEGSQGGVRLNRAPEKISLLDIFEAVELKKSLFRTDYSPEVENEIMVKAKGKVLNSFDKAEASMKQALSEVCLRDLFGCEE